MVQFTKEKINERIKKVQPYPNQKVYSSIDVGLLPPSHRRSITKNQENNIELKRREEKQTFEFLHLSLSLSDYTDELANKMSHGDGIIPTITQNSTS